MNNKQEQQIPKTNMQKPTVSPQNKPIDTDTLYNTTHDIAKNVLAIRKESATQTKKILVVGQAMVTQKAVLDAITAVQKENDTAMRKEFNETLQTQTAILKKLDNTYGGIQSIEKSCDVQNKLINSLCVLKDHHAKVMSECQKSKQRQVDCAIDLQKQLSSFQQLLSDMAIEDKCMQIEESMKSIMDTLQQYYDMRKQQRETLKQHIDTTTTLLVQFQEHIKKQGNVIAHIEKQAAANSDITITIDKKLDMLLAYQEKKMTAALPTLEEAFGVTKPKEMPKPMPKPVQEASSETEPKPMQEPEKKKSVLKSLFGGK